MKKYLLLLSGIATLFTIAACKKEQVEIDPGDDPNFTIITHSDQGYTKTNRKVVVFDIPIYAYEEVEDAKLLHAANILAQYLDNDEDGIVDNATLHSTLIDESAALFMWKKSSQINLNAQDLGADETNPDWHTNGHTGNFDACLEEVWHVITHSGYSKAYPNVFGEQEGSALCNAMDLARGGTFTSIPKPYPAGAWYTYDDRTCDYSCMATEYIYWSMTSILGAQENRLDEISHEWDLNTQAKMQAQDSTVYNLLTDPQYQFPTVLPDGTYKH